MLDDYIQSIDDLIAFLLVCFVGIAALFHFGSLFYGNGDANGAIYDVLGQWKRAPVTFALITVMLTSAVMLTLHLLRFLSVVFYQAFPNGSGVSEIADISLFVTSALVLATFGVPLAVWVFKPHSPNENYLIPGGFIALAILSVVISRANWLYGFKAKPSRNKVQASRGQEGTGELQQIARRQIPKTKFTDIYGNADIKRRMFEAGRAITAQRKKGSTPRNGILMHGGPGNGKTIFAEALAGELGLPLYTMTHTDVASQWVGERTTRIKAAFEQAVRNQPCALFIDEIDSFIPDRATSQSSVKEDADVVNALLTLLVDVRKHRVLVIAATNYIDRLDPAAVREGRFDFKVEITPPDQEARVGLLTQGLKSNMRSVRVSDQTVRSVAERWNGFSVKRILAVTEELPSYLADKAEKGLDTSQATFDDFMAALRRTQGRKGSPVDNAMSLDQLVLPDGAREGLEMIASRLRDPLRVERLGGTLPTGVLFHGPAGTGKTSACKSLAKAAGWAFLPTTGAELARDLKVLEKIHDQAKELRPAIIFIDEADELLRSREYSPTSESTNKLLTLMDGAADRARDVLWVAATNHPDLVDAALMRGGRFTEKVEFELPSEKQLGQHIAGWLTKRMVQLAPGITAAEVADMVGDESIANAEAVLQYALNRAISHSSDDQIMVRRDDLAAALMTVLGRS